VPTGRHGAFVQDFDTRNLRVLRRGCSARGRFYPILWSSAVAAERAPGLGFEGKLDDPPAVQVPAARAVPVLAVFQRQSE